MKSSRLLALLMMLQRRRKATAGVLAEELGVSVRTLYRDIAALMEAGVPLWTETGPHGGVHLMEGWQTKLDGLTAPEASALFLSGAPKALSDLGLASVAVNARAKVDATLPEALRGRAGQIRERFLLDAPGWYSRPEKLDALPVIAEAVWSSQRLSLRYGERSSQRTVDPLGLVLKAGTWYLVARHRGELRSYRVSRCRSAKLLGMTFQRPAGFDLEQWWASSTAAFDASLLRYPCRLKLSPWAMRRLVDLVPNDAIRQMLAQADPPDPRGWRTVALRLESEAVAVSQLVGLADGVEVLEPPALRTRLRELALKIAALNEPG